MSTQTSAKPVDIFDKAEQYERWELIELGRRNDLIPYYRVVEERAGPVVRMEGRDRLMFGSNNYLGLTTDKRVLMAARHALDRYGTALTGARLQNGTIPLHHELEREIASWMGTDDALVFTTGYQANLGCISALAGPDDTVLVDSADHASILDGCMLSGARVRPFRHNRVDKLEQMLERTSRGPGGVLVVVDGVFSMEGTIADLPAITRLCRAHGARLLVDEAHAVGVLGARGAGTAELLGVEQDVDLRMGTFSKSLASCGGFIAGPARVIDYLRFTARAFLFTVSAVPAATGAALQAIRICRSQEGPRLFQAVLENASYLREGLRELGYRVPEAGRLPDGTDAITPIIPILVGDDMTTGMFWKALWDQGLYVNVALYPAVPPGQSLLRASVMASHEQEHLDRALEIFACVRDRFPGLYDHDRVERQEQWS